MQVFFVFYDCFADLWHISVNKYTPHQLFGLSFRFNSHSLRFPLMRLNSSNSSCPSRNSLTLKSFFLAPWARLPHTHLCYFAKSTFQNRVQRYNIIFIYASARAKITLFRQFLHNNLINTHFCVKV